MEFTEKVRIGNEELHISTGKIAKQANGSVMIGYGETMVLVTACAVNKAREGMDFLPLTCDYIEKTYAAGKIPGGFFKREGRPTEKEVLTSRLLDRPMRPLFPSAYQNETQVIATVVSADSDNNPDVVAMCGAAAALEISDIPFQGPFGAVRVGRIDGQLVANPTYEMMENSELEIIMAATPEAIIMVEGQADIVSEEIMQEALTFGHEALKPFFDALTRLREKAGLEKWALAPKAKDEALEARVKEWVMEPLKIALNIRTKLERYQRLSELKDEMRSHFAEEFEGQEEALGKAFNDIKKDYMRSMIVDERRRIDARALDEVRKINCEIGLLPRTHGSALFTRGETQALVIATLGTSQDEQRIDGLQREAKRKFMLHYNFPPFSVGEVKFLRSPNRREVGHGALAEKSITKVLPQPEDFPYTIRIVSEIMESNGSSSMATVCGSSLALMDAGVPVSDAVAGIAMGLIKEGDKVAILSDILGDEDHYGDMDFKVTGTRDGICALQMDIKITGITQEIMKQALIQAREGRLHILDNMAQTISTPEENLKSHAPRIMTVMVKQDRIRDIIGPGGRTIRGIVEETGVSIDVEDDGKVSIASANEDDLNKALKIIKSLTQEAEIDKVYLGTVRKITDFGAFVEILPGMDGLVHISELSDRRVENVTDVLQEGDEVLVKVLSIDRQGKIRLSRRAALGENIEDFL